MEAGASFFVIDPSQEGRHWEAARPPVKLQEARHKDVRGGSPGLAAINYALVTKATERDGLLSSIRVS